MKRFACALGLEATNPHVGIKEDHQKLVTHFYAISEVKFGSGSAVWQPLSRGMSVCNECGTRYRPEENTVTSVQPRTALDRVTGDSHGTALVHN